MGASPCLGWQANPLLAHPHTQVPLHNRCEALEGVGQPMDDVEEGQATPEEPPGPERPYPLFNNHLPKEEEAGCSCG